MISQDNQRRKDLFDSSHENRNRTDDQSTADRRFNSKLRDKTIRKIYQELHVDAMF